MAWRFVRQPNGMLAPFSEVCDDFTMYDLSPTEAADEAECKGMTRGGAWAKVGRALDDAEPLTDKPRPKGDGLSRWRECLVTIREVHGAAEAAEVERELSKVAD